MSMANGAADPVAQMIQQAANEQRAQQMLHAVLMQAMQAPHTTTRMNVTMVALADEEDRKVLMVALPTGERLEIPLAANVEALLRRSLTADTLEDPGA